MAIPMQETEQEKEERLASVPKLCRNCEEENKAGPNHIIPIVPITC